MLVRSNYAIHEPFRSSGIYSNTQEVRTSAEKFRAVPVDFNDQKDAEDYKYHGQGMKGTKSEGLAHAKRRMGKALDEACLLDEENGTAIRDGHDERYECNTIALSVPGHGASFGCYYAVARGRMQGIYKDWEQAKKQVGDFNGKDFAHFNNRAAAVQYMRARSLAGSKIRRFPSLRAFPKLHTHPNGSSHPRV
jgi:hypothetical protein